MKKLLLSALFSAVALGAFAAVHTSRPDGEAKYYQRTAGLTFINDGASLHLQNQAGFMEIIYSADGTTAWIKNPICGFATEEEKDAVWIEGSLNKAGTELTVALGQDIYYDSENNDYLKLYMLDLDEDAHSTNYTFNSLDVQAVYAIDGESVTLRGTNSKHILGLVWNSDKAWSGFGDYETVYTEYVLPDMVTPPADLQVKEYPLSAFEYMNEEDTYYHSTVYAGFDGNDVYIQGLDKFLPMAWVKGTLDATGSKVKFDVQYIGTDPGQRRHFLTGWNIGVGGVAAIEINYYKELDAFESTAPVIINSNPTMHHYYAYYRCMFIGNRPDPAELPSGLTETPMVMTGKIDDTGLFYHKFTRNVSVAFDGDDVYFQGLSFDVPEAWVKGTLSSDGTLTIPSGQFMGVGELSAVYLHGMNDAMTQWSDITMTYDPSANSFTTQCTLIEASAMVPRSYLWRYQSGVKIYFDPNAPTGADPNDLQAVKYLFAGKCSSNTSLIPNGAFQREAFVARDGNLVYVKGLSPELPDAWAKGELVDDVVTFAPTQLLGNDGLNTLYFSGIDLYMWTLTEFKMKYNASDESFKFIDHAVINRNATSPNYTVWYQPDATLTKDLSGIEDVTVDQPAGPAAVYNLQGIRVEGELTPGRVYIVGGRKVLAK